MVYCWELQQFVNCRILRNHTIIKEDLWVRSGKVIDPEKVFFDEKQKSSMKIDCKNAIIAPGFIDLQINGGFGVDFSYDSQTEYAINRVAKHLLPHGVTSFCPTLVTSPKETYQRVIPKIPKRRGGKEGAGILGIHLEGPFINPAKKGAHPENLIKDFDCGMETVKDIYGDLKNAAIITLAPEKTQSEKIIQELTELGITVAVGHSIASLSIGEKAVQSGASLITHLFNAMLPFHHRDPGLVGLLASNKLPQEKTMYYGIISDGVHTHPAALRIAYRTNPEGLILVTDAISAMGLEHGKHQIGQLAIEIRDKRAYIADTDTLCGSIAAMDECVRIFRKETGCSTVYALEAASLHPAKCLGLEKEKGTLRCGADADFLMLDDDLNVLSTWISGECVYKKPLQ
ncbi:AMDHD2 family protein [Megaselia abdita]